MSELLAMAERVRNAISLGESHFREFKSALEGRPGYKRPRNVSAVCRDIAEALVAFVNADGGDLLVGVEDDGEITGIPHDHEQVDAMLASPTTHVYGDAAIPLQYATRLSIDGKQILFFSVLKGSQRVFQLADGRCVRRSGTSTVPESAERIMFDRREASSRSYDSEFVDGASVSDLDLGLLQATADRYLKGITPERYLQQVGLAQFDSGGLVLRKAALILFARDIVRWHPRSQVRVIKIVGNKLGTGRDYRAISDEYATGNLLELLVRSWEQLRPFLAYKTEFGEDTRFEQKYIYPEDACREALINALTHRDYTINNPVEIFVFDERMEIKSPGGLLSTLSVEQITRLEGAHESRNSLIARALREAGYVRELGEGMRRIFELVQASDLKPPTIATTESTFSVTLFNKSIFSEQQISWLALFTGSINLSLLQQRIVVAGMNDRELSPNGIYQAMNTRDRNTYDREVSALRASGLLVEVRTNSAAASLAQEAGKAKGDIGRFRVVTPDLAVPLNRLNNVVLSGVPADSRQADIRDALSEYGQVKTFRFSKLKTGVRKVYVRMADGTAAETLIRQGRIQVRGNEVTVERPRP